MQTVTTSKGNWRARGRQAIPQFTNTMPGANGSFAAHGTRLITGFIVQA